MLLKFQKLGRYRASTMRNAVALLAILALATAYAPVNGDDNTYVSNQSATVKIRASIRYDFLGTSQFTNRLIMPKTNGEF